MIQSNNFIDWVMQLNFNMIAKATEVINKEGGFDVIHAHDWLVSYAAKTLKQAYSMPKLSRRQKKRSAPPRPSGHSPARRQRLQAVPFLQRRLRRGLPACRPLFRFLFSPTGMHSYNLCLCLRVESRSYTFTCLRIHQTGFNRRTTYILT